MNNLILSLFPGIGLLDKAAGQGVAAEARVVSHCPCDRPATRIVLVWPDAETWQSRRMFVCDWCFENVPLSDLVAGAAMQREEEACQSFEPAT